MEDISDRSKTAGVPVDPVSAPPLAAAGAPTHQRRFSSTTAGPPSVRPYGLSSAHAISNRPNQQQLSQQTSSNRISDDDRYFSLFSIKTIIFV